MRSVKLGAMLTTSWLISGHLGCTAAAAAAVPLALEHLAFCDR